MVTEFSAVSYPIASADYHLCQRPTSSSHRFDQLLRFAALSRPPEAFQVVELAGTFGEDVDDKVQVVHQDPLAFGVPLDVSGPDS